MIQVHDNIDNPANGLTYSNKAKLFEKYSEQSLVEGHIAIPTFGELNYRDNSIDISYFVINTLNYISLNFIPTPSRFRLESFLYDLGFKCIRKMAPVYEKRYKEMKTYEHQNRIAYDGKPFRIELSLFPNEYPWTGIKCKIFYPDKYIIDEFVKFFITNNLVDIVRISFVELTFDFYTDYLDELLKFFEMHMFKHYNRSEPRTIGTTHYQQSKRKTKDVSVYPKYELNPSPVRLELRLKRRIIKSLGLRLKSLDEQLRNIDFGKYFDFRIFDRDYFHRVSMYQHKKAEKKAGVHLNRSESEYWTKEKHLSLVESTISSYSDWLIRRKRTYEYLSASTINYRIKKMNLTIPNAHRFIKPVEEWNTAIFDTINGRPFLH